MVSVRHEDIDHTGITGVGGGAAADVSIADAGAYFTGTDVEAALQELGAAGGGGGGGWSLLVDNDLSSHAAFTSENGTWGLSEGVTKQTGTGTNARLRYNTIVPQAVFVAQVDVRFPSAGQTAGAAGTGAGLVLLNASGGSSGYMNFQLTHNGSAITSVGADRAAVAALRFVTISKAFDTWVTIRLVNGGLGAGAYYVDGTFVGNMGYVGGNHSQTATPDYLGLYCYTAKADFRNLKVWGLTLP